MLSRYALANTIGTKLSTLHSRCQLNRFWDLFYCPFSLNCCLLISNLSPLLSPSLSIFPMPNGTCFRSFSLHIRFETLRPIQVAPMATLRLGPTLNAESIKEGDDVYFECSIQAYPDVLRLVWKHEVRRDQSAFFDTFSILNSLNVFRYTLHAGIN